MAKTIYPALFISLIFLSCSGGKAVMAGESVKDIELIDTSINFTQAETKSVAYLCMELKNNSAKNIVNLNLEVSYYDTEGHSIKKVVLKDRLAGAIPPGEARKYKIRLNGDVFNDRYEEYPYSRRGDIDEFDVKILNVKFASR